MTLKYDENGFLIPGIKGGKLIDRLARQEMLRAAETKDKFIMQTLLDKMGISTEEEVRTLKDRLQIQTLQLTDTKQEWRLMLDGKLLGVSEYEVGLYDGK